MLRFTGAVARLRLALAGLPLPAWPDGRIRLGVDVSPGLRPDAATSPGRLFCHVHGRGKGQAQRNECRILGVERVGDDGQGDGNRRAPVWRGYADNADDLLGRVRAEDGCVHARRCPAGCGREGRRVREGVAVIPGDSYGDVVPAGRVGHARHCKRGMRHFRRSLAVARQGRAYAVAIAWEAFRGLPPRGDRAPHVPMLLW
jgi:hypothetical protein